MKTWIKVSIPERFFGMCFFSLPPRCRRYYLYLQDLLHLQPLKRVAVMPLHLQCLLLLVGREHFSVCSTQRHKLFCWLRAPTHILFVDFYLHFLCLHRFLDTLPLNSWYVKSLSSKKVTHSCCVFCGFFFPLLVPVIVEPRLKLFSLVGLYEVSHWSSA